MRFPWFELFRLTRIASSLALRERPPRMKCGDVEAGAGRREAGAETESTVYYHPITGLLYSRVYSTVIWIVVSYSYVLYSTIPGMFL